MKSNKFELTSFFESIEPLFEKDDLNSTDDAILEDIQPKPGECFFIFDLTQNKITYLNGIELVLGHSEKKIDLRFLSSILHPEDADVVQSIIKNCMSQVLSKEIPVFKNVFRLTSRMKTKNRGYVKILSENFIFQNNKSNQVQTILVRYTDVSFLDKTNTVDWWVNEKFLDKKNLVDTIYGEKKDIFTSREKEIIVLMFLDKNSKSISEELNISHHTVATHRKNIFSKSKLSGIEELKTYCKKNGVFSIS